MYLLNTSLCSCKQEEACSSLFVFHSNRKLMYEVFFFSHRWWCILASFTCPSNWWQLWLPVFTIYPLYFWLKSEECRSFCCREGGLVWIPGESVFASELKVDVQLFLFTVSSLQISPLICSAGSWFQYGDVMVTAAQGGQREMFMLPAPGVTANCVDNSPAGNSTPQGFRPVATLLGHKPQTLITTQYVLQVLQAQKSHVRCWINW